MNDLDLGDVLSVRLAGGKVERRSGIARGPLSPKQGILSGTSLHALERMAVDGPESAGNPIEGAANVLATRVSTPGRLRSSRRWARERGALVSTRGLTLALVTLPPTPDH